MAKPPTYPDDKQGWHKRWGVEFKAAKEALGSWHKDADDAIKQYHSEGAGKDPKLRLWSGHVNLREAIMYGKTPKVDVARRYNDAEDHVGRVAATILNRLLNGDIERDEETYPRALGSVLKDWLMVSFGNGHMRYVRETEPVEAIPPILDDDTGQEKAPGVPATEKVTHEDVETDYSYWKHQLWGPAHVFSEVRWWAFRTLVSSETSKKKFGVSLPMKVQAGSDRETEDKDSPSPLDRSVVWEIWDKEHKGIWWYCEDHKEMLVPKDVDGAEKNGMLPDPLGLRGFWPFPEPLTSNTETSKYVPQTDYSLAKDQFQAIDNSTGRIELLKKAIAVRGIYDKTVNEVQSLLGGNDNKLVAAQNFVALAEKGGIVNCVAWLPLEPIIAALDKLRELRREEMELLIQITGDSDIVRGQAMSTGVTATEQSLKAKFASIPMQKAQIDFARYASQAQSIRAEIISKHFDPETIMLRANVQGLPDTDKQYVDEAIALLKSDFYRFRVVVKPEAISLTDYAANKQEAMDVLGTIGTFFQAVVPMAQAAPAMAPMLLQLLQKFIAKTKGGEDTEGILDQAIEMAKRMAAQPPQPPAPDPTAVVKAQAEVGKAHATIQKTGLDMQRDKLKFGIDVQKMQMDSQRSAQEHAQGIQSEEAKARADILKQVAGVTGGGQA
jgi:hypothetical protein